jgi:hypothetical protein
LQGARAPTPSNDVTSPEKLAEELSISDNKAIAVKIDKIWEVIQLPVA